MGLHPLGISDILQNLSYSHRCPGATAYRSAFEEPTAKLALALVWYGKKGGRRFVWFPLVPLVLLVPLVSFGELCFPFVPCGSLGCLWFL